MTLHAAAAMRTLPAGAIASLRAYDWKSPKRTFAAAWLAARPVPPYDLGPMTKSWHLHRHAGAWDGLGKFQVERIASEGGELAISIASPSGNAIIRFESFYGFRVYDELALSNYWQLHGGVPKCGVYASDSTEHLEWAAANSVHQIIPKGCTNYLIVSTDDVVDVVGSDSPTVQIEP